MAENADLGMKGVQRVYELWQVDSSRSVWHDDGFDWWPGNYRQRVRAAPSEEANGVSQYRLKAATDFLAELPMEDPRFLEKLNPLLHMSSTYGFVVPPLEAHSKYGMPRTAMFVSSVYVNQKNHEWAARFFAGMALLQPSMPRFAATSSQV